MTILIVHPERATLERLGHGLRLAGFSSVRTCHLVAAVVYIRQLSPEVIVAGGFDPARGLSYAELLARCSGYRLLRAWPGDDLALLHHQSAAVRDLGALCAALGEDKTKKAAPAPPSS